jgi:hypothetical protein
MNKIQLFETVFRESNLDAWKDYSDEISVSDLAIYLGGKVRYNKVDAPVFIFSDHKYTVDVNQSGEHLRWSPEGTGVDADTSGKYTVHYQGHNESMYGGISRGICVYADSEEERWQKLARLLTKKYGDGKPVPLEVLDEAVDEAEENELL